MNNIFDGFRQGFGQCILGYLVPALLSSLIVVPGAVCLGIGIVAHEQSAAAGTGLIGLGAVLLIAGVPFAMYLSICWMFTLPLVIDKRLDFWSAMKLGRAVIHRHWWSWFGLALLAGLVGALGIVLCCVGALFTIPITFASVLHAYEDVFGSGPAVQS